MDQVATTTLILSEPLIVGSARIASVLGINVDPEQVRDNMFGEATDLMTRSHLPVGANKISYGDAMNMSVSPVGSDRYDKTNITFHQYDLDVTLCYRSESFCTIPNLAPMIDYSSAPKADYGLLFQPMEDGRQVLIGGNPIIHSSDYAQGSFTNPNND